MNKFLLVLGAMGAMSSCLLVQSLRITNLNIAGPCPDNFTGNVPNPLDCHTFYICDAGSPSLFPCPLDLCFNPAAGEGTGGGCDHCDQVPGCGGVSGAPSTPAPSTGVPSTGSPSTAAPSTAEPSTGAPPSSTAAPTQSPTDATPTVDPSTASPSTTSVVPSTTIKATTPENGDLPCPDDPYIYMPYPGDCNKFYYCVDGKLAGVWNCQEELWFRFSIQVCDRPWASTCQE